MNTVENKKLKIGDNVRVMDKGLIMLQQFAPPGAKPNNEGIVSNILEDGMVEIEFPLEGHNHSQAALYPMNIVHKINIRSKIKKA